MEAHVEKGTISCASFHLCADLNVFRNGNQQHAIVELAAAVINTTCDAFSPHEYSDQREGTPVNSNISAVNTLGHKRCSVGAKVFTLHEERPSSPNDRGSTDVTLSCEHSDPWCQTFRPHEVQLVSGGLDKKKINNKKSRKIKPDNHQTSIIIFLFHILSKTAY